MYYVVFQVGCGQVKGRDCELFMFVFSYGVQYIVRYRVDFIVEGSKYFGCLQECISQDGRGYGIEVEGNKI